MSSEELVLPADPKIAFTEWLKAASTAGAPEPTAMTLATASRSGEPHARTVLFKGFRADSLTFYTNYDSAKAADLLENPRAALVFFWPVLKRQIRIVGDIIKLSPEDSFAYFKTRARGSRIGAWSSPQSQVVGSREELEKLVAANETRFKGVEDIPLPPNWGGYALLPASYEFWEGREFRVHERFIFKRGAGGPWVKQRLAP